MTQSVLVMEPEFSKAQSVFRSDSQLTIECASADEHRLAECVRARKCRAVIVGVDRYDGPLYEALGETGGPDGAVIARFGVGCDGIDKDRLRKHNIVLANTPGALDTSVAEHTLWLLGSLARRIPSLDRQMRAGDFRAAAGIEVRGKTLGVIGFGAIGRRVAAMAHFGLAMTVFAADCRSVADLEKDQGKTIAQIKAQCGIEQYTTDVDTVLRDADITTIHISANARTRGFFNAERLSVMKPGAWLINTARGSLVDECALYDALVAGRLGGAALDVFVREPYEPQRPDKDLRTLENVVLTPHVASNTHQANARMAHACVKNIRSFFAGRLDEMTRVV